MLALFLVAGITSSARSATHSVEPDGSGDFTEIQDAIDAAAAGDSILIGPGRYTDFRPGGVRPVGSESIAAVVWVTVPNLTLLGSGMEETIIGPQTYQEMALGRTTGGVFLDIGCDNTTLRGIAVENVRWPGTVEDAVQIRNSRWTKSAPQYDGWPSLWLGLEAGGSLVSGCEFLDGNGLLSLAGSLTVEDCTFLDPETDRTGLDIGGALEGVLVRRCTFIGGLAAMSIASSTVRLEDIHISGTGGGVVFQSTIPRR